jgi:hypothetical protein
MKFMNVTLIKKTVVFKTAISLLFVLISQCFFSQTTITIGTGTTFQTNHPFVRNYNYGWSKQVYLQSEINLAGNITAIAFENNVGTVTSWTNQTIYMRHVTTSTCTTTRPTAAELSSDWTLVFNGTINFDAAYKTITLSTSFNYNNSDNIEVYYENRRGTNSSNGPQFRETAGANRSVYYRNDALATFNASTTATGSDDITNIRFTITPTCQNPSSAGVIANTQSSCGSFDPSTITSSSPASGETGTLEYKWQQSTTSAVAGFTDIPASNSATYDPSLISQTTWYKRLARVNCRPDWVGAVESNVIQIVVSSPLVILNQPVNDTVYLNTCKSSVVFTTTLTNTTDIIYQWQLSTNNGATWIDLSNSVNYNGVITKDLTVLGINSSFNGYRFRCNITNSCGSVISSVAILAVISWYKNIVINEVMCEPLPTNCHNHQSLLIQSAYTQAGPPMECDGVSVPTSSGNEWIELYNPYCTAVDISHWFLATTTSLSQGHGVIRFPSGTSIPANGYLTIGGQASLSTIKLFNFFSTYGNNNILTANIRFYLDNNDHWLGLYGPKGEPVDAVFWTFSNGESSKWGTDSDIRNAPTLIPIGSVGAPLVTDSLPGPRTSCLTSVREYLSAGGSAGRSFERTVDGGSTWQLSDIAGGTINASNNGAINPCTPLPVTWLSFEALKNNRVSDLYWSTASETNNDYFEVQRSVDTENWEKIGIVAGAGITSYQMDYMFTDVNPYMGINYYRIKQVDFDGNSSYSDVRAVSFTGEMMLVPNPSNGNFTVVGMPENSTNSLHLINSLGQVISVVEVQSASYSFADLNLASGIYYLTINNQETIKVVITKSN